jgi:hypothetical protein
MTRKTFRILTIFAAALGFMLAVAADPGPAECQSTLINGQPAPRHGAASTRPADRWEWAMVSGNGRMGALVFGQPLQETIIVNHGRLWLPLGSREVVPDLAQYVPELRQIIKTKDYDAAMQFFLGKAREQGFPGLIWTDPGHMGFELKITIAGTGVQNYLRTEDFRTGEVAVRWQDVTGGFCRRLFVSRPDNVIALSIRGPKPGALACDLSMGPALNKLIQCEVKTEPGWITSHNVYVKGKGGYNGLIRVVNRGGRMASDGSKIHVAGADEVLALMRIEPWREPLEGSDAWAYSPKNPAVASAKPVAVDSLKPALTALPANYEALLASHARVHAEIFDRVTLDLGGGADRNLTTDELLERAAVDKKLSPALLEKMYDAGRYMFLCASGDLPPNLFGIWTGTWTPAWSGDFTTDTNLEHAVASGFSANMPELMDGYFNLIESMLPDWRLNARRYYGARGVLACPRTSNNGLLLHWGSWPGVFWTCGAGWMAHWFYDRYLYTGDREFLARRTVPLLKECAEFYEDFLFTDESGKYRFSPSYSAENGCGDNSTMDIAVAKEVLTNLIAASRELGIEQQNIPKWQAMLAKMPPYLVNQEGALQEWARPGAREHYDHRHYSNLYPLFQSYELSPEETPELWKAACVATKKRLEHSTESAAHGRMHGGLCAARARMGDAAYKCIEDLATRRMIFPSMIDSHNADHGILCVDGNGCTPEIINNMLIFAQPGLLDLLPALPTAMPRGSIHGILARGQIKIGRLAWDHTARRVELELTSRIDQTVTVRLPNSPSLTSLDVTAGGASVKPSARGVNAREVTLPKGRAVKLMATFAPGQP